MNAGDISFPNLGLYLENVPREISVFGLTIALYGVFIGIGAIVGFATALWQGRKEKIDTELLWDFILPALFFSVIGARLYYVIFEWDAYKNDLLSIFNIREGGLAIYGGVIAGFTTCYIFTRIKKIPFLKFADICVTGLIVGQIFGRFGNFTNREVFGGYSDGLFCMRLPIVSVRGRDISTELYEHVILEGTDYVQVHPTFLYESVLNLCILLIMLIYRKHKAFQGELALIYLGGYGIVRFFLEGIRTDRLLIGNTNIAVSQVLGLVLFIFAVATDLAVRIVMTRRKAIHELADACVQNDDGTKSAKAIEKVNEKESEN